MKSSAKKKRRDFPFRIAAALMMVPLLASVVVQYNDPDGVVWMLIYGYSIVVTLPAIFGTYSAWAIPGALGYLGGFAYLMPGFETPILKSEITREGGGLLITGVWTLCVAVAWYLHARPAATPQALPHGTLLMVPPEPGTGHAHGGCGSGRCGCGKN